MKKSIFLFSTITLFLSCATKPSPVSYQVLSEGDYNGRKTQTYQVIDNHQELNKLYDQIKDDLIPKVDFAKSRVVALHLGEKNTGGYSIGIENVRKENGKIIVRIKKTYPQGAVTMAFTQPYMIAKINTNRKIEFEE